MHDYDNIRYRMSAFDSILRLRKKQPSKNHKKQVILRSDAEVDLYYQIKGKMQAQQKTFSDWLVKRMKEEIGNEV